MVSHAVWKTWPSGLSNDKKLGLRPRFLSTESLGPCFSHGTGDHDQILQHIEADSKCQWKTHLVCRIWQLIHISYPSPGTRQFTRRWLEWVICANGKFGIHWVWGEEFTSVSRVTGLLTIPPSNRGSRGPMIGVFRSYVLWAGLHCQWNITGERA